MPNVDDRNPISAAVLVATGELTKAVIAARNGTLDVHAWNEEGMQVALRDLRQRADEVIRHLSE